MQKSDKGDLRRLEHPPLKQTFKNPTFQLQCKHRRKQIYIDKYKDRQGYRCKDRRKQVNMYVQRQTQTYAHFDKNMQTDMHANTDANT